MWQWFICGYMWSSERHRRRTILDIFDIMLNHAKFIPKSWTNVMWLIMTMPIWILRLISCVMFYNFIILKTVISISKIILKRNWKEFFLIFHLDWRRKFIQKEIFFFSKIILWINILKRSNSVLLYLKIPCY